MKQLSKFINEQKQITEAATKEGVIVAGIILAASFCVPNALGLIYQLGKYGFKMINRRKLLDELPELTAKDKEEILELTKNLKNDSKFGKYIEMIEKSETPEELLFAIDKFYDASKYTINSDNVRAGEWEDIKRNTENIYIRNKEMSEKVDKKLRLRWTVSPLVWLSFVSDILGSSRGGSVRSGSSFGGGRSGGGGFSGRW